MSDDALTTAIRAVLAASRFHGEGHRKVWAKLAQGFADEAGGMASGGGKLVRTIGLLRVKAKIGMQNLVYNMSRFVHLERMATPV